MSATVSLEYIISSIFPRPNGTAIVIADEMTRHPIAAKTKVSCYEIHLHNLNLPDIFHFSDLASDNSRFRSDARSFTFSTFTSSTAFPGSELFDLKRLKVKFDEIFFLEITFALF